MKVLIGLAALVITVSPAFAQQPGMIKKAIASATASFERAAGHLGSQSFGVDISAYRDALVRKSFAAMDHRQQSVVLVIAPGGQAECARFAAFVRPEPQNNRVNFYFCPQFFEPGADRLRELTVLHEMVHVVAGPDECRAMAFAAEIEIRATGAFTPVDRYWRANGCQQSAFALPG